ncbi:MAG TPA: hypothetical protein ENG42_01750 [Candidatus Aenigmarchaeota archaeon]|nr:MAG: hypothetical protein DRP03_00175 [Candidatus Aenigmarchaeota archaeon]HDD46173.1 hypothetical protein [Candidatus Aenigmarchaeota archaeon]
MKADGPEAQTIFIVFGILILIAIVSVIFLRFVISTAYTKCWSEAVLPFYNIKEGNSLVSIGDCVDHILFLTGKSTEKASSIAACIGKSGKSFIVIVPRRSSGIISFFSKLYKGNLLDLVKKPAKTECIAKKYRISTNMERIDGPGEGIDEYCMHVEELEDGISIRLSRLKEGEKC